MAVWEKMCQKKCANEEIFSHFQFEMTRRFVLYMVAILSLSMSGQKNIVPNGKKEALFFETFRSPSSGGGKGNRDTKFQTFRVPGGKEELSFEEIEHAGKPFWGKVPFGELEGTEEMKKDLHFATQVKNNVTPL